MKFVYFGYDQMLPAARRLISDGHEMLGVFTFHCDNVFNFNIETIALGQEVGALTLLEKPEMIYIEQFIAAGAEVFIGAGFPTKIPVPKPPEQEGGAYAMNIHPTLLPIGRGLMPTPTVIMHAPQAAGLTIHKLTEGFDEGDILAQTPLPLSTDETVDTYSTRITQESVLLLSQVMADLPNIWAQGKAQDESKAQLFPVPDDAMRTITWDMNVKEIDKITRAFGSFGCLGTVNNVLYAIYALNIEQCAHDYAVGSILSGEDTAIRIAVTDGIIEILKYSKA